MLQYINHRWNSSSFGLKMVFFEDFTNSSKDHLHFSQSVKSGTSNSKWYLKNSLYLACLVSNCGILDEFLFLRVVLLKILLYKEAINNPALLFQIDIILI